MGDEPKSGNRSGGINITGGNITVGGDIVGRDKISFPHDQVNEIFRPLAEVVRAAAPVQSQEAARKVEELKVEDIRLKRFTVWFHYVGKGDGTLEGA